MRSRRSNGCGSWIHAVVAIASLAALVPGQDRESERERERGERRSSRPATSPTGTVLPADWVKSLKWRSIGPAGMGGRITAISVFEADPVHVVGRDGVGRAREDDEQRRHVRAPVRPGGDRLDRRRGGRALEQGHRLGRHRRGQPAQLGQLRRRRLQVDRRRQDLEEHGPREDLPDRSDRDPSEEPGRRLRRRARPPLRPERGARPLQDDRRRQDVDEGPLQGRQDRRHRHRDEPGGSGDADRLRCGSGERDGFDSHRGTPPVPEGYDALRPRDEVGPERRPLQDDGRRQDLEASSDRACPRSNYGRCDVDWYRKDPNVVYAIIDCEKIGMGPAPKVGFLGVSGEDGEGGAHLTRVTPKSPAEAAGLKEGDVVVAVGEGAGQGILGALRRRSAPSSPARRSRSRSSAATSRSSSR